MGPRLAALAWAGALASALASGCGRAEPEPGSLALRELEGLAFLPSARFVLVVSQPELVQGEFRLLIERSFESRVFQVPAPFLIDRFEVTREHWRRYALEAGVPFDALLTERMEAWEPGTEQWPVTFITRAEAEAFAAWRGMHLCTVDEWLSAALGTNRWPYPWGTTFRESVANTLELGLGRPAPVGTFEAGRTPSSCYDLLGNVSEWVSGAVPSPDRVRGDGRGSALGGSFRTYTRREGRAIYDVSKSTFPLAFDLHPGSRSDDVGLRCAADAETYLWERAADWGEDARALERLAAVGERFGRQALPLLARLAARPGAPAALTALVEGARR